MKPSWLLKVVFALVLMPTAAVAAENPQRPGDDRDERHGCIGRVAACGVGVVVSDELGGVDNCSRDPNCRTRRIVDANDPMRGTDFMPVPDEVTADGGQVCTPRPAGLIPPSFDSIDLPGGTIGVNPHHEHLTGLESWFWYEGPASIDWTAPGFAGVTADCAVTAPPAPQVHRAELVELAWHIDDGWPATYRATGPGSSDEPAARHTYQTAGTWTVTVTCTWQGDWGPQVSVPCGSRDLDVIEVRSQLTTP